MIEGNIKFIVNFLKPLTLRKTNVEYSDRYIFSNTIFIFMKEKQATAVQ